MPERYIAVGRRRVCPDEGNQGASQEEHTARAFSAEGVKKIALSPWGETVKEPLRARLPCHDLRLGAGVGLSVYGCRSGALSRRIKAVSNVANGPD